MNEMFSQGGKGSTGILTNKQAIARKFGVKQNEVVYFAVGVDLGGYKVIYDKATQRAYSLPVLPVGTTAVSLDEQAVLVHSAGTVDLGELAATRREFVSLSDTFATGLVVNTRNELLFHNGIGYTYLGTLPVTITTETNPVGNSDWKPQTDPNLRDDLADTSDANLGDAMLGVKNTRWSGTVNRTQHDVNLQIINLKDFGAKLDGVTDDTAAVQLAIDSLPYNEWIPDVQIPRVNFEYTTYWVDGGPGIALVSDTIRLRGGVNIRNITLRADVSANWDSKPVLAVDSNRYWGKAENLIIDGNHAKCKGVSIKNSYGSIWRNIQVLNTQLDCFTNVAPGYEFFMSDFRLQLSGAGKQEGATYQDTAVGLNISSGDGHYSNGAILWCPVGVVDNGGNFYDRVHAWSGFYNNGFDGHLEMRLGFYCLGSNSHYNQCYADSPSKKDYTNPSNTGILSDGLPNGGIGFFMKSNTWNCTFVDCNFVASETSFNACTDGRSGLTNQLRSFVVADGSNNRFLGMTQNSGSMIGDPIFGNATAQANSTVIGVERHPNQLFNRVAGQDVLRIATLDTSVSKLIRFYGAGAETGYVQQRDANTIRYYANRNFQFGVGASAPFEVYAGTDGVTSPTLRYTQNGVANLGDSSYRYITVYLTTNPNVSSDARLKSEVQDIPDALVDLAMSTPIKRYKLNSLGEYHYGIIITEEFISKLTAVESEALNGLISVNDDGMYGIAYTDWQNILLEGMRRKLTA